MKRKSPLVGFLIFLTPVLPFSFFSIYKTFLSSSFSLQFNSLKLCLPPPFSLLLLPPLPLSLPSHSHRSPLYLSITTILPPIPPISTRTSPFFSGKISEQHLSPSWLFLSRRKPPSPNALIPSLLHTTKPLEESLPVLLLLGLASRR